MVRREWKADPFPTKVCFNSPNILTYLEAAATSGLHILCLLNASRKPSGVTEKLQIKGQVKSEVVSIVMCETCLEESTEVKSILLESTCCNSQAILGSVFKRISYTEQ